MNALPIWRTNCGAHSLEDLRGRLRRGQSVYVLFPEGTRTRDGAMGKFKPGIGRKARLQRYRRNLIFPARKRFA